MRLQDMDPLSEVQAPWCQESLFNMSHTQRQLFLRVPVDDVRKRKSATELSPGAPEEEM